MKHQKGSAYHGFIVGICNNVRCVRIYVALDISIKS